MSALAVECVRSTETAKDASAAHQVRPGVTLHVAGAFQVTSRSLRHDLSVDGYTWPTRPKVPAGSYQEVWAANVAALPLGASVSGEVIGRQPFLKTERE